MLRGRIGVLVAVGLLAAACGGTPSRAEVLADLADQVIVPTYRQFQIEAVTMHSAIIDFCASPDQSGLDRARGALDATRRAWYRTEAMWVGPVMERRSWSLVNWPVAPDEIEALIADTAIGLDLERLTTRIGSDQRGLGALEYVLHAGEDSLAALQDPRRCEYLTNTAAIIASEAQFLLADWEESSEGGAAYREVFSVADGDGLDSMVNDSFFLLESITDLELGNALGLMSGPVDLDSIQEGPAGGGVADLGERLLGLQAVMVAGESEAGLSALLEEELAAKLTAQIETALAAITALESPLRKAVAESPAAVAEARDAVKAVQITVATEVIAQLGVAIGFSDADGDSSG